MPFPAKHPIYLLLVVLFLLSRALGVFGFAPHNDEIINAEFAQMMAADWQAHRFVTLDGTFGNEFKRPLQFWLGSLTVGAFADPLTGLRLWTFALGLIGFVCAALLVARLYGPLAALFTAAFILQSEYYLYFDSVAITEAFVYGAGTLYVYLLCVYLQSEDKRTRAATLAGCCIAFVFVVAAKRSGLLWVPVALALPLALGWWSQRRRLIKAWAVVIGITLVAELLVFVLITGRFSGPADGTLQNALLLGPGDLARLPVMIWLRNVFFFVAPVSVADGFGLPLLALLLSGVVWLRARARDPRAATALARSFWLPLAASLPVLLVAKTVFVRYIGFGQYFIYATCALALSIFWKELTARGRVVVVLCFAGWFLFKVYDSYLPLVRWGQTDIALQETPDAWARGIGFHEVTDHLATLPPGLLIHDHRWGLPGTGIRVYRDRYPELELVPAHMNRMQSITDELRRGRTLYLVFAHDPQAPPRPRYLLLQQGCGERIEFSKRYRGRVLPGGVVFCRLSGGGQ